MVNRRRGEVEAALGGRRFTLVLTLGALAELEAAFGVDDLVALGERFASGRLSASDLTRILGAGIRGGGTAMSDEDVAGLPVSGGLDIYVGAVAELLAATFGSPTEAAPNPPMRPQGGSP